MFELLLIVWVARGGRLYRTGISSGSGRIQLGNVGDIADRRPAPQLSIKKVDEYELQVNSSGDLVCDIFWDTPSLDAKTVSNSLNNSETLLTISRSIESCGSESHQGDYHKVRECQEDSYGHRGAFFF